MRSFADINEKIFFQSIMMILEVIYDGPYNQEVFTIKGTSSKERSLRKCLSKFVCREINFDIG